MKCYSSPSDFKLKVTSSENETCRQSLEASGSPESGWCPGRWDGLACWSHTPPGTHAEQSCPTTQPGFHAEGIATKYCRANGTWWLSKKGKEWANYTACVKEDWFEYHSSIRNIEVTGYVISCCFLLLAIITFMSLRSLRCLRITLHLNFFASFIITNITEIAVLYIESDAKILFENPLWCRTLLVINIYTIVSNFAWMFCEGLYLHTALVRPLFTERRYSVYAFLALGWGTPLIPAISYALVRSQCITKVDQLDSCWVTMIPEFWWIFAAFVIFFELANLVFMANILRLVVGKLNATNVAQEGSIPQAWKSAKALFILIPILGVHYVVSNVYRPSESQTLAHSIYQHVYAIFTSFQGTLVAFILCFLNSETRIAFKRRFRQWRVQNSNYNMSTTDYSFFPWRSCQSKPSTAAQQATCNGSEEPDDQALTMLNGCNSKEESMEPMLVFKDSRQNLNKCLVHD